MSCTFWPSAIEGRFTARETPPRFAIGSSLTNTGQIGYWLFGLTFANVLGIGRIGSPPQSVGDLDALRGREREVLPNIPTIGSTETAAFFTILSTEINLAADQELPSSNRLLVNGGSAVPNIRGIREIRG